MLSKKNSRVLIVLPTLGDRIHYLNMTLESIKNQTGVNADIVLICPKNKKRALGLASKYGAKIIDDPGGLSAAVNAGVQKADKNHEYIGWIGDDDLLTPNSLYAATQALDNNPKAVLAFGYCEYIDDNARLLFTSKAGKLAPWIMTWGPNLVPLPGILFRKNALDEAGPFDPDLKYSMDLDMLLRLRKIGSFINTKERLAAFRWHADSTTVANRKASLKEARSVKKRYLPKSLRLLSPVWELPVGIATLLASKRVNKIAARKTQSS